MKKAGLLGILCACALFFTGCSLTGLDAQGLISPPKANVDQQEIHALLKSEEGQMNFVYPKTGEYRSAVMMRDFTGDSTADAIGFCVDQEGGISLRFMSKNQEGKWKNLDAVRNTATQVDRVLFGDLNGDGKDEVIVGWGAPQSMTAVVCVYTYTQEGVKEYQLEHPYNDFLLIDFNQDKIAELFTATVFVPAEEIGGENRSAMGRVYTFIDAPKLSQSVSLSDTVGRYTASVFVPLDETRKGIVLEGLVADGGTITQVLHMEQERLVSPLAGRTMQRTYSFFLRPASFTLSSRDVDEDGIVEFPKLSLQPGYSADNAQEPYAYYVDWVKLKLESYGHQGVQRSIINFTENFYVTIPEQRTIICKSQGQREYLFEEALYGYSGKELYRKKLFSVKVFAADQWQEVGTREGYGLLFKTQSNLVYGVKKHSTAQEPIIEAIKPITE